jgi:multidrug resistance efflux pump
VGYTRVLAPVSGKVTVLAAREGEVVGVGGAIATVTDLSQTWVYAGIPETQADALQVGDPL